MEPDNTLVILIVLGSCLSFSRIPATFLLAALTDQVSQIYLTPVYGGIPSKHYNSLPIVPAIWVVVIGNMAFEKSTGLDQVTTYLCSSFPFLQALLVKYSGKLGPTYGPHLNGIFITIPAVVYPLLFSARILTDFNFPMLKIEGTMIQKSLLDLADHLATTHFVTRTKARDLLSASYKLTFVIISTLIVTYSWNVCQVIAAWLITYLSSGDGVLSTRAGLEAIVSLLWIATVMAESRLAPVFGTVCLIYGIFFNPHLAMPHTTARVNATLQDAGYSLVARRESLTGYLSVLDNVRDGFRVMRCDHSLLGGEWINKPHGHPAKFNEPIYSIFVMLEAVRLVVSESGTSDEASNSHKEALVVGLGIGTAPSALIAHGVQTSTVEIDPVVHDFASRYFGLPQNHTSIIGDAVQIVDRLQTQEDQRFDYIIHDVFTGGVEPIELFTYEFLTGLSNLLTSDGVVAINYGGDLLLSSSQSVMATVTSVFSHCRFFRETPPAVPMGAEDYTNLVMFCKKSSAFVFRDPVEDDFLGSPARREHLLPQNEVINVSKMIHGKTQIVRRGHTKAFEGLQYRSAVGHWYVMRKVLPDVVWESW